VRSAHKSEGVHCSAEELGPKTANQSRARLAVSDISVDKRKKLGKDKKIKKKQSAVASHTGKFADEATVRAVIAAACDADEGSDVQGVVQCSDLVTFGNSDSQRAKLRKKHEQLRKKHRQER
jgi:hypothetical protein